MNVNVDYASASFHPEHWVDSYHQQIVAAIEFVVTRKHTRTISLNKTTRQLIEQARIRILKEYLVPC
jgi:hypothetical protein